MKTGDRYIDKGGAIRVITDIINDGEEIGYRYEAAVVTPGGATGKHFQSGAGWASETQPYVEPVPVTLKEAPVIVEETTVVIPEPVMSRSVERRLEVQKKKR